MCRLTSSSLMLSLVGAVTAVKAGSKPWATSVPFALDIKAGIRESIESELVTFDSRWLADAGKESLKISVNGTELFQTNGCGEVVWSSRRPGTYAFACQMYEDGVLSGDPLTATFVVVGHVV